MSTPRRFERDPAIVSRQIGTEIILVPVRSSTETMEHIFALNDTAALIWQTLAQPCAIDQLVAALLHEYEVSQEQAYADVGEWIELMLNTQLIREVADGTLP